jgi:hypothetical protein
MPNLLLNRQAVTLKRNRHAPNPDRLASMKRLLLLGLKLGGPSLKGRPKLRALGL